MVKKLGSKDLDGISEIDVCFGNPCIYEDIITKFPNLKWFHSIAAGNEKVIDIWRRQKVKPRCLFTRTKIIVDTTISQFVLSYILWNEKRIFEMYEFQKQKIWSYSLLAIRPLHEVSVAIVGLGFIGKEVGKLCKSMGMTALGITRNHVPLEQRDSHIDEYRVPSDLKEVLSESDYIVNVLPATPSTTGYFSGNILSMCKKIADNVLENCRRFINNRDMVDVKHVSFEKGY